jgi:septal ring factor EnvC (AmiA/AmiB activator)
MQALINSADTLSALADSLLSQDSAASNGEAREWLPPVAGRVLQPFGTGAGDHPGWSIATESRAIVTTPADASVRFSDVIPRSGRVVILEADGGRLIIISGLSDSFVRLGDVLEAGAPVGFAGLGQKAAQDNLNASEAASSLVHEETLYIEIRQAGAPLDPATLLKLEQEQG